MEITIREAEAGDEESIKRLNVEVFEHDAEFDPNLDLAWPDSPAGGSFYKALASGEKDFCFIAEYGGEPVGFISLHRKNTSYRKGEMYEVDVIGVSEEFRGKGIGTQLMRHAEDFVREKGADGLLLDVYSGNESAIGFYTQNGFYEVSRMMQKKLT